MESSENLNGFGNPTILKYTNCLKILNRVNNLNGSWEFVYCIQNTKTKTAILNCLNIVNSMKGLNILNCTPCLKIPTKGVQGFPNIQIVRLMVLGLCILYIIYKRKRLKRLNSRNCLTIQITPHYTEIVDKALNILTMYANENGYGLYNVYKGI